jgi:ATP phosphoribosyltransferase regulatory subunit
MPEIAIFARGFTLFIRGPMTLLPSGFFDSLTPDAEREAWLREHMLATFTGYGYARVAPPLMEFEETLLSGPGASLNRGTFRVMDAVSHRMLALRPDHTLQIGRIAASRLADAPRPLRLSYAGQVVSALASERNPARQKTQVGIEIIGSLEADADAEVILLGRAALAAIGVTDSAVDLLLPTLVTALLDEAGVDGEARKAVRHALDRKDEADVARLLEGNRSQKTLVTLLRSSGPAPRAMAALKELNLPEKCAADCARLEKTLQRLVAIAGDLTIDFVESRCFEYQTGLSFSFFSKSGQVELGRGGRYRTASDEPATGLTFYADALMPVLPAHKNAAHLLVPFGLDAASASRLQGEGYVLVQALGAGELKPLARAQGCAGYFDGGKIQKI